MEKHQLIESFDAYESPKLVSFKTEASRSEVRSCSVESGFSDLTDGSSYNYSSLRKRKFPQNSRNIDGCNFRSSDYTKKLRTDADIALKYVCEYQMNDPNQDVPPHHSDSKRNDGLCNAPCDSVDLHASFNCSHDLRRPASEDRKIRMTESARDDYDDRYVSASKVSPVSSARTTRCSSVASTLESASTGGRSSGEYRRNCHLDRNVVCSEEQRSPRASIRSSSSSYNRRCYDSRPRRRPSRCSSSPSSWRQGRSDRISRTRDSGWYTDLPLEWWEREEGCKDAKAAHMDRVDDICRTREDLVLLTTLWSQDIVLEPNMFPCEFPSGL